MSVNDPHITRTEVRHTYGSAPDPAVIHTTEVRDSSAGWWLGALVAIVAILAVVFLVTREPTTPVTTNEDIARAVESSRTADALANAQMNVNNAALSAQDAANRAAANATMAANEATQRAEAAARSAAQSASDAANRAPTATIIVPTEPLPQ